MSTRSLPSRPPSAHGGDLLQAVLGRPLAIADARTVLAREYGFDDRARLSHRASLGERVEQWRPHPRLDEVLAAMDAGDADRLQDLLDQNPELVHARAHLDPPYGYFTGATLLHHVARNPGRRGPVPGNMVAVARQLLVRRGGQRAETL